MKKTIIYFGNEWGADNRTSSHHIASRLIRDFNVIYVECPGLRTPDLNRHDITRMFKKIFQIFKKTREINSESFVKTMYQIPFHDIPFVKHINRLMIKHQVRKLYQDNGLDDPILWFVLPHVSYALEDAKSAARVYYCVDEFAEMPGVNRELIAEHDKRMTELSDAVFVISDPLYEQKKRYGDKIHLSKHGVDFEHFYQAVGRTLETPKDVAHLKAPIIGFFGLIESWIDLDLIEFLAKKKPDWTFLMIGRVAVDYSRFDSIDNVHFIGPVTYETLPAYSQIFDVALIPVETNELIRNFNPLKLREYLAMGLPIVSTYFPEIEVFGDNVYVANEQQEFLDKIQQALDENCDELAQKRANLVESSSWENRYKKVRSIVEGVAERV